MSSGCETRSGDGSSLRKLGALIVFFALALSPPAEARHHQKKPDEATEKAPEPAAEKPAEPAAEKPAEKAPEEKNDAAASAANDAAAARAISDYPAATRKLEEAYRKTPSSELLYQLGLLSDAQGKVAEAQDFMRRYLADPTTDAAAPGRVEAERVMALPRPQSGEVQVLSDQYGFVTVDGRLVGALPFPAPLLLPVGQHVIMVEVRDRALKGKVKVADGRGVEISFNRATGAAVVTLPPAVIVLPQYSGTPVSTEVQRRLLQAVEQAIQKARLAVFSKDVALGRSPKLANCLNELSCQAQLAAENEVEYALRMRVEHTGGQATKESFTLQFNLVDAEVADSAAAAKPSCDTCSSEQMANALLDPVRNMIKEGQGRARGTLSVTSDPSEADVKLGDRVVGKTPYKHATFVGSYDLVLEKSEYQKSRTSIEVKEGKPTQIELSLKPEVKAPVIVPKVAVMPKRPLWRLVSGGLTLGLGVAMMGFGISALAVNGGCVSDPLPPAEKCSDRFTTKGVGGALLGVGIAVSAGGAVLLALPVRAKAEADPAVNAQ